MVATLLIALWFMLVCLYLLRQQWSGELDGRDA
jgi:hypothetical protein